MVKKILVTTDLSECGNKALEYTFSLAKQMNVGVTVLSVIEREHHESRGYIDMKPQDSEERCKKARRQTIKQLEKFLDEKSTGKVKFEIVVDIDRVAEDGIIETVRKLDPDILVMASHGYSGFKKFLLGSTTDRVMRSVECPVLLIKAACSE